mmetsp:Transcript_61662/g.97768  ORF Transcript_61662/g.97768 Transcript_61662/m.97768 type:complete len:259 (+) Transcript_61662:718-1494(+)
MQALLTTLSKAPHRTTRTSGTKKRSGTTINNGTARKSGRIGKMTTSSRANVSAMKPLGTLGRTRTNRKTSGMTRKKHLGTSRTIHLDLSPNGMMTKNGITRRNGTMSAAMMTKKTRKSGTTTKSGMIGIMGGTKMRMTTANGKVGDGTTKMKMKRTKMKTKRKKKRRRTTTKKIRKKRRKRKESCRKTKWKSKLTTTQMNGGHQKVQPGRAREKEKAKEKEKVKRKARAAVGSLLKKCQRCLTMIIGRSLARRMAWSS